MPGDDISILCKVSEEAQGSKYYISRCKMLQANYLNTIEDISFPIFNLTSCVIILTFEISFKNSLFNRLRKDGSISQDMSDQAIET